MVLLMWVLCRCLWLVSSVVSVVMLIELLRLCIMLNMLEVLGSRLGGMLFIVKLVSVIMISGWFRVCMICVVSSLGLVVLVFMWVFMKYDMVNKVSLMFIIMWLFSFVDRCVVKGMMKSCGRFIYMMIRLICIGV